MIYVILPFFNRLNFTLKCLKCFQQSNFRNYEILIVDDGSTDHSAEIIKKTYPEIEIMIGSGNWWWSKSLNQGLANVLPKTTAGDYILIINNDTTFGPDYLDQLVSTSQKYNRSLVGSLVVNPGPPETIQDAGVKANWSNFTFPKSNFDSKLEVETAVDCLATRGLLIPVEVFTKVKSFSRVLPHHSTDYDFTIRAKKSGFRLVMSYKAKIYNQEKPGDKSFSRLEKYFSRRSSANLLTTITFAIIHAPNIYLKLKAVGLILFRCFRGLLQL